jgi:hypothetical protein
MYPDSLCKKQRPLVYFTAYSAISQSKLDNLHHLQHFVQKQQKAASTLGGSGFHPKTL